MRTALIAVALIVVAAVAVDATGIHKRTHKLKALAQRSTQRVRDPEYYQKQVAAYEAMFKANGITDGAVGIYFQPRDGQRSYPGDPKNGDLLASNAAIEKYAPFNAADTALLRQLFWGMGANPNFVKVWSTGAAGARVDWALKKFEGFRMGYGWQGTSTSFPGVVMTVIPDTFSNTVFVVPADKAANLVSPAEHISRAEWFNH